MQSTNFISTDILFFLLSQFLVCTPQEENDAHVASIVSAENAARKENDYYSSALQFLAPVNNKLTQKWTLWRDPAFVAQSKQLSEKEYFETLENLGIFSNMDSFCEIWNAQMNRDPEGKSPRENFLLFRDNIKPTWEDPNNTAGGKWTLTVADPKLAQEIWLSLITAMVYNQLDIERDHLCGAVLSVRPWGSLISLWNRDSTDYRRIVSFTNTLCKIFHLKAKDVRYVVHRPAYPKKPAAVPNNPPEPSSSSFSSSSFRNTTRLVDISNVAKPHKVHQVAQKAHGNNNNSNGRYESASGKKRQQRSVRPALNLKPTKKEVASEGEVVVVQSEQQAPNAEFGQSLFDLLDEKPNVKEIRLDSDSTQKIEAVPLPAEPVEQPKIVIVEEQKPVECAPLVASSPVVVDEKPKPEGFKWRGLAPSLLIASTAVVSIAAASAMYLM